MTPVLTSNNHALNMFLSTYGGVHYKLRSFLGTVQSKLTDCIKELIDLTTLLVGGVGGGGVLLILNCPFEYSGTPLMRPPLGHKILVVITRWSH